MGPSPECTWDATRDDDSVSLRCAWCMAEFRKGSCPTRLAMRLFDDGAVMLSRSRLDSTQAKQPLFGYGTFTQGEPDMCEGVCCVVCGGNMKLETANHSPQIENAVRARRTLQMTWSFIVSKQTPARA